MLKQISSKIERIVAKCQDQQPYMYIYFYLIKKNISCLIKLICAHRDNFIIIYLKKLNYPGYK
jgi:hypothetical protein